MKDWEYEIMDMGPHLVDAFNGQLATHVEWRLGQWWLQTPDTFVYPCNDVPSGENCHYGIIGCTYEGQKDVCGGVSLHYARAEGQTGWVVQWEGEPPNEWMGGELVELDEAVFQFGCAILWMRRQAQ